MILGIALTVVLASCNPSVQTITCADDEIVLDGECVLDIPEIDWDSEYPGEGVVYQLFVRSFADSDGDGIGDFTGIKENLDYFTELGIDTLWLMPIHPSPTYHGYDVMDYYDVNPDYGTMADFDALVQAADEAGIDIILDFLINHTSIQHEWFQGWISGDPEYDNYYRSITSDDPRYDLAPGAWKSLGGGNYYYGYFYEMADLNWSNPTVQQEMIDAALFWLDKGVDGFRLDAAKYLEAYGEVSTSTQPITSSLNKLAYFEYKLEEQYPDVYISGEVWSSFSEMKLFYQSMDSVLNFETGPSILKVLNSRTASSYVSDRESEYEQIKAIDMEAIDAPFLYNHDQDRLASIVSGDMRKLKLAAEMLLTLEGNPHLYYGEEIGMYGYKSSGPTIWDETRRLPLKWGNDYTTTWHPDTLNGSVADIETQFADSTSLLNVYKNMLQARHMSPALRYGELVASEYSNNALVSYYRVLNYDADHQYKVLVVHNVSEYEYQLGEIEGNMIYYSDGVANYNGTIAPSTTFIIEVPFSE
jgi:glycosidase